MSEIRRHAITQARNAVAAAQRRRAAATAGHTPPPEPEPDPGHGNPGGYVTPGVARLIREQLEQDARAARRAAAVLPASRRGRPDQVYRQDGLDGTAVVP